MFAEDGLRAQPCREQSGGWRRQLVPAVSGREA